MGKVRVLIADDEPHVRGVMRGIVTSLGGEVVGEASDGEQAVATFEKLRPHMVILDINMPKLTGDRALRRILEIEPKALAIMMTAQDSIASVRECLEIGARNYILKSNPAEDIYKMVAQSWSDYVEEVREGSA